MSRWQLAVEDTERDPLSPWYGEPKAYLVTAPERGTLTLHPSRVVRFLGAPLADPGLMGADLWSDSVLTALYDAIHAVALTTAGATSLMHEAKVDVVTVPNLSEHLSNAATTAQLSARFGYAAAMKSLNNLLLLGDGETWARQKIDFAGLPEMVRTFLQVAAGAADIPVTRLLGQSPAGLSATGDSDIRNYYDMIAARQEIDLRPQLERLDRLLLASAGIAPGALGFTFRPLWQMDAATKAATALQKAQATAIYAGLGLWPKAVMAGLVAGQIAEDGIYPDAGAVFSGDGRSTPDKGGPDFLPNHPANDWPGQPRNRGEYAEGKMGGDLPIIQVAHFWEHAKKERKRRRERRAREERQRSHEEHEQGQEQSSHVATKAKAPGPAKQEHIGSPSPGTALSFPTQFPSVLAPPPAAVFDPAIPTSVGPGPFAHAAVPAGPSRKPTPSQQALINEIGKRYGCHTCGTMDPATDSGNWVGDHQPPTSLTAPGTMQFYLSHCSRCSRRQGGLMRGVIVRGIKQ